MKKLFRFQYWIIGSLVGIAFVSFVVYKQHGAAEKYKHHHEEYCAALIAPVEQKKSCIEERVSTRDYLPWWFELISWPEGLTTWAIILTGFAIAWQSNETRRSANASQVSHEVARNKEKPRISITMDNFDLGIKNPKVNYSVIVRCPIPAYIKSAKAGVQARVVNNTLAPTHLYSIDIPNIIEDATIFPLQVDVSGEADSSRFSQGAYDRLKAGETELVFLLHILFEDAYGEREFMKCKILSFSALKNLDGSQFASWRDGPRNLQRDN